MNDSTRHTPPCAGCGLDTPLDPYRYSGEHCPACIDLMIRWDALQGSLASAIAPWRADNGLALAEERKHLRLTLEWGLYECGLAAIVRAWQADNGLTLADAREHLAMLLSAPDDVLQGLMTPTA